MNVGVSDDCGDVWCSRVCFCGEYEGMGVLGGKLVGWLATCCFEKVQKVQGFAEIEEQSHNAWLKVSTQRPSRLVGIPILRDGA